MAVERDYVLGTHDEELARLGLQHQVWRERVHDAWRRAGLGAGATVLDVGCGPGYAALDLAALVGPGGRVLAVDRSRRFLAALERACAGQQLGPVATFEQDLDEGELPAVDGGADAAWCRWVFAFVRRPRELLARVARALRPGGVLVFHEYFDYRTWRLAPRSAPFERFVRVVMESWRADGGEPDIGLDLAAWLPAHGFEIRSLRPIVDVVTPANAIWPWPRAFVEVGLRRLVALGRLADEEAAEMRAEFARAEAEPDAVLVTPAVLEGIATRL